jgi:hypothetical protein
MQALLQIKPKNYEEIAIRVWQAHTSCLKLWLHLGGLVAGHFPSCLPYITGLSSQYLQYKKDLSAGPRRSDLTKKLAKQVFVSSGTMCKLASYADLTSDPRDHWEALFASPGLIDAALTQLAGLAKYLHKQHLANQLTSDASGALAKKDKRGSPAARVVGAGSFAQLLLYPHHDNVAVAGGKQAIAAQAEYIASFTKMSLLAMHFATVPTMILRAALSYSAESLADAAPAQSADTAAVAAVADVGRGAWGATEQGEGEVAVQARAAAAPSRGAQQKEQGLQKIWVR